MKVELKNVKHFAPMSEETECFTATIYIDGKRVGTTQNQGHGGPTDCDFDDPEIEAAFKAFCKTLPPYKSELCPELPPLEMDPELYVGELLEAHLAEKDRKRVEKRIVRDKAKNAANGFPVTLKLFKNDELVWTVGLRSEAAIPAYMTRNKGDIDRYEIA
jgi:hypothetical protein